MSDQTLAKVLKLLTMLPELKRIVFVNMRLGPITAKALQYINKKHVSAEKQDHSLGIDLRGCKLIGFK